MAKRDKRLTLTPLGEYYADLLQLDAWITGRSQGMQGASLLTDKLQEREAMIKERIEYLARKRNIPSEDMRLQILKGEADPADPYDD
jgi:hypothetical protein